MQTRRRQHPDRNAAFDVSKVHRALHARRHEHQYRAYAYESERIYIVEQPATGEFVSKHVERHTNFVEEVLEPIDTGEDSDGASFYRVVCVFQLFHRAAGLIRNAFKVPTIRCAARCARASDTEPAAVFSAHRQSRSLCASDSADENRRRASGYPK